MTDSSHSQQTNFSAWPNWPEELGNSPKIDLKLYSIPYLLPSKADQFVPLNKTLAALADDAKEPNAAPLRELLTQLSDRPIRIGFSDENEVKTFKAMQWFGTSNNPEGIERRPPEIHFNPQLYMVYPAEHSNRTKLGHLSITSANGDLQLPKIEPDVYYPSSVFSPKQELVRLLVSFAEYDQALKLKLQADKLQKEGRKAEAFQLTMEATKHEKNGADNAFVVDQVNAILQSINPNYVPISREHFDKAAPVSSAQMLKAQDRLQALQAVSQYAVAADLSENQKNLLCAAVAECAQKNGLKVLAQDVVPEHEMLK